MAWEESLEGWKQCSELVAARSHHHSSGGQRQCPLGPASSWGVESGLGPYGGRQGLSTPQLPPWASLQRPARGPHLIAVLERKASPARAGGAREPGGAWLLSVCCPA